MKPLTVLIAESDIAACTEIQSHLLAVSPEVNLIVAKDGVDAWQHLTSHHIDLLILNLRLVAMPGIVLIDKLVKEGWSVPPLILTGHFDNFLRQVLHQAPIPFLHQPIAQASIKKLLHSAHGIDMWQHVGGLVMFLEAFHSRLPWQDKVRWLRIEGNEGHCLKHIDNIFYFRRDIQNKKIRVGTDHGEHWLLDAFRSLVIRLDPERFWRISRHTVINALHVVAAGRDYLGRQWLELRNGMRLKVSSGYERFDILVQLDARQKSLVI